MCDYECMYMYIRHRMEATVGLSVLCEVVCMWLQEGRHQAGLATDEGKRLCK